MYSTGIIRVTLKHYGKSIPHNSHPLELCSPSFFLFDAFCLSHTNKWSFKFQRWPLSKQSQKQLHFSLGTLMIFKSTHTWAVNKMIDTAHAVMLVSHVIEISNESICGCPINSPARGAVRVVASWCYCEDEKEINSAQTRFDLIT